MIRKIIFFIWLGLIVLFTISPYSFIGKDLLSKTALTPSGFFQHVFGYFILGTITFYTFDKKRIWLYLIGLLVFGIMLEFIQYQVPSRTFNVYDILGNGVGLMLVGVYNGVRLSLLSLLKKNNGQ